MQPNFGDRTWHELGFIIFAEILLALLAMYVPVLHFPALLLFPLPVALTVRKYHLAVSLWCLLAVTLVVFFALKKPLAVLSFTLEAGIIGVVIGLLFKNYVSPGRSLRILTGLAVIITLAMLLLAYGVSGIHPFVIEKNLIADVDQLNELYNELYNDLGLLSQEEQRQVRKNIENIMELMAVLVPGSMVIWAIIRIAFSYFLADRMFRRLGYKMEKLPPFSSWQYPWYIIWGLIIGLALFLVGDEWNLILVGNIGKNVLYVMAFLFIVSGSSVFTYFIKRWKVPAIIKGMVAFIIILYWPLITGLILILGILDTIVNLRKIGVKGE